MEGFYCDANVKQLISNFVKNVLFYGFKEVKTFRSQLFFTE